MLSRAKFLRNRLDGRGVDHFTGSLAKIERRYRARQKHLLFRRDDRAPEEGHRCERHKVFQRNRPGQACCRRRHQARAVHSFGVWQSAARHAIHRGKSQCGSGLAGSSFGDRGWQRCSLDGSHGLRLDRCASRHRQPHRAVQDGVNGNRLHYVERESLIQQKIKMAPALRRCHLLF